MSERRCLRCKTVPLTGVEPRSPEIHFFECPKCGRRYAQKTGKELTFRWLHPISLALYDVIFHISPGGEAARVAAQFIGRSSGEELELFVREIRLELEDPTQQVRDILDCRASELVLRQYLHLFAAHIEEFLVARRAPRAT